MAVVLSCKRFGSTIIQNISYIIFHNKRGRIANNHRYILTKNILN